MTVAVLVAFVWEENKVMKPIYYISKALIGVEPRYPPIELLAFTLAVVACRLRTYLVTFKRL